MKLFSTFFFVISRYLFTNAYYNRRLYLYLLPYIYMNNMDEQVFIQFGFTYRYFNASWYFMVIKWSKSINLPTFLLKSIITSRLLQIKFGIEMLDLKIHLFFLKKMLHFHEKFLSLVYLKFNRHYINFD